jgi:fucose permease
MIPTTAARARAAVLVVFGASGLIMSTWVSRVPALRDEFGLSDRQVGWLLLAMSVGAVLALPAGGPLVERLGPRPVLRGASTVCSLGLAVVGVAVLLPAGSVAVCALGLFCVGAGAGTWDVAMNVEGAAVERRLERAIMPQFHGAFSIGTVVGALLGAASYRVGLTTSAHLLGVAAVGGLLAPLAGRWFLSDAVDLPAASGAVGAEPGAPAPPRRGPLAAWREPRTLTIGLLVLTFAFAEGSAGDWLALAFVDGYRVPNATGALGFGAFVAAMTAGRFLGPALLGRFGRVAVLRACAGAGAVGLLLVGAGQSVQLAGVGAVLWGLGASLGFPVGMSAAADGEHAASRVGVVSSIGYTAFLAGPPLIGGLAERFGVLRALWVVLAALLLGAIVSGVTRPPNH